MILDNLLKLHKNGCAGSCVSIHQLPYSYEKHRYTKTYFEEESQNEIMSSEIYKKIKSNQVDHFNVIGGGMYKVELCIYLKE